MSIFFISSPLSIYKISELIGWWPWRSCMYKVGGRDWGFVSRRGWWPWRGRGGWLPLPLYFCKLTICINSMVTIPAPPPPYLYILRTSHSLHAPSTSPSHLPTCLPSWLAISICSPSMAGPTINPSHLSTCMYMYVITKVIIFKKHSLWLFRQK